MTLRTLNDHWTFECNGTYVCDLKDDNNIFAKFINSLFETPSQRRWIKFSLGYLISPLCNIDVLLIWRQKYGGGGKTLLADILHHVIPGFVAKLSRTVVLGEKGNVDAEMNKLNNIRITYFDEAGANTNNNITSSSFKQNKISLNTLLQLSGGGVRQCRDLYEGGQNVKVIKSTHKTLMFCNENIINSETALPINRRCVYIEQPIYFRDPNEMNYNHNDKYCRPRDHNIRENILKNCDHVITYLLNGCYLYVQNPESIIQLQPQEFKLAWQNTKPLTNEEIIKQFITNECEYSASYRGLLRDFVSALNRFTKYHNYNIQFNQKLLCTYALSENITKHNGGTFRIYGFKIKNNSIFKAKPL